MSVGILAQVLSLLSIVGRGIKGPYLLSKRISACDGWICRLSTLNIFWKEVRRFIHFFSWKWESHRHVVVAIHISGFVWHETVLLVTLCSGIGNSVPSLLFYIGMLPLSGFYNCRVETASFHNSLLELAAFDTGLWNRTDNSRPGNTR